MFSIRVFIVKTWWEKAVLNLIQQLPDYTLSYTAARNITLYVFIARP